MNNRILLIDNDVDLTLQLRDYLGNEGFKVCICNTSTEATTEARNTHYNLIILDIVNPDFDGLQLLKSLKKIANCPIMIITTRDEQFDRIYALETGADDYLIKPLHSRELLIRIKVIMRRITHISHSLPPQSINIDNMTLCRTTREAYCDNRKLSLTGSEFEILFFLMINAGKITSKESISRLVLGRSITYDDRSIDMHISNIRKKSGRKSQIKTIRGIGYIFLTHRGSDELPV